MNFTKYTVALAALFFISSSHASLDSRITEITSVYHDLTTGSSTYAVKIGEGQMAFVNKDNFKIENNPIYNLLDKQSRVIGTETCLVGHVDHAKWQKLYRTYTKKRGIKFVDQIDPELYLPEVMNPRFEQISGKMAAELIYPGVKCPIYVTSDMNEIKLSKLLEADHLPKRIRVSRVLEDKRIASIAFASIARRIMLQSPKHAPLNEILEPVILSEEKSSAAAEVQPLSPIAQKPTAFSQEILFKSQSLQNVTIRSKKDQKGPSDLLQLAKEKLCRNAIAPVEPQEVEEAPDWD